MRTSLKIAALLPLVVGSGVGPDGARPRAVRRTRAARRLDR